MKKLLCTFLIGALLFTGAGIACLQNASADETLAETDYFASDFTELPSDWELSDQCCGEEYMDTSYADGDMVIRQDPAVAVGAARYYGSLYLIDKDTAYEDFTFEITFKMTEAKDDGRWMGIVYHLQKRNGYPIGYMMNYRYGGYSAFSAVNENRGFADGERLPAPSLKDGAYHTVKIVMRGTQAQHIADGKIITEWDTSERNQHLGEALTDGGFGLIVNQSVVSVQSVRISRTAQWQVTPDPQPDPDEESGIFDGVPEDWKLYEECAVDRSEVSCENGNLIISHAADHSVSATQYYGAVYLLDTENVYSDFTLEITVKAQSYFDLARWFGIMYHTRTVGSSMIGYLMNYRYAGVSASSAVDASRGFNDDPTTEGLPALTDRAWHTIRIEMRGTVAAHYIDDKLIKEWDVTVKDDILGGTLESGGFALIVNRSTLQIQNYKIEGTRVSVAEQDETIVSTYQDAKIKMTNAPTVVCEVTDRVVLNSLTLGERRPSNAILHINDQMYVVDANGKNLDTFDNVLQAIGGKIIPVVYVSDEASANALITYFKEIRDLLDVAVMSGNPALVKKVRSANNRVRGIIEYGEEDFESKSESALYNIVKTTNFNFANVAVIPQSAASVANVRYIQARFKTVWVKAAATAAMDLYDCVGSGAYGVVNSDFNAIYDILESYGENILCRMPFNVAHRGLPKTHNENSVSGVKAAIAAGATHLEIDGHICKADSNGKREIVIMHNATINDTTNGTGAIADMTLEEIRRYKLNRFGLEEIPTLDDIFEAMKGSNAVLVFEIKTNDAAIVPLLKEKLNQFDEWDRVVVISFYTSILGEMKKVLPEVPTANLNTASEDTIVATLNWMGLYNTGVDTTYPNTSEAFNLALRDRGVIGWYWTYDNGTEINMGATAGYVGLTNNEADAYDIVCMTVVGKETSAESLRVGDEVRLLVTSYSGAQRESRGIVIAIEEHDAYWRVVASYRWLKNICTQSFRVEKAEVQQPPEENPNPPENPGDNDSKPSVKPGDDQTPPEQTGNKGCNGAAESSALALSVIGLGIAVVVLRRNCKDRRA